MSVGSIESLCSKLSDEDSSLSTNVESRRELLSIRFEKSRSSSSSSILPSSVSLTDTPSLTLCSFSISFSSICSNRYNCLICCSYISSTHQLSLLTPSRTSCSLISSISSVIFCLYIYQFFACIFLKIISISYTSLTAASPPSPMPPRSTTKLPPVRLS